MPTPQQACRRTASPSTPSRTLPPPPPGADSADAPGRRTLRPAVDLADEMAGFSKFVHFTLRCELCVQNTMPESKLYPKTQQSAASDLLRGNNGEQEVASASETKRISRMRPQANSKQN
eukprot:scaffold72266_cov53-Phaeocystis_antarctica.AAC.4